MLVITGIVITSIRLYLSWSYHGIFWPSQPHSASTACQTLDIKIDNLNQFRVMLHGENQVLFLGKTVIFRFDGHCFYRCLPRPAAQGNCCFTTFFHGTCTCTYIRSRQFHYTLPASRFSILSGERRSWEMKQIAVSFRLIYSEPWDREL